MLIKLGYRFQWGTFISLQKKKKIEHKRCHQDNDPFNLRFRVAQWPKPMGHLEVHHWVQKGVL